jgi:hypothetical protein
MTDMSGKRLQPQSDFEQFDADGDGVVTDSELEMSRDLQNLKQSMEKAQAQRAMAWFALLGMLLYPSLVVVSSWFGLTQAADLLGNMAPTYYVSTAALVASYYGASAWQNRGNGK